MESPVRQACWVIIPLEGSDPDFPYAALGNMMLFISCGLLETYSKGWY
jgi:hypothetical protein